MKNKAIHEVETLAAEGNFANEFAIHFRSFFDEIPNLAKSDKGDDSFLISNLKESSKKIFESPFPKYNLYLFKIPDKKQKADLLYCDESIKIGKKSLCKAFEYLYNVNIGNKDKENERYAKGLLGKHINCAAIAEEMRGITTNTRGMLNSSFFIWDYINIKQKAVYGAILISNEIDNNAKNGRLLALKRLQKRGKALGAFIPVYKDYGEPDIQSPLDKSDTFKKWAFSLTIKSKDNIEKWLRESLPQGHNLGKYSAFCHLERGYSHIAIVVVKSLEKPKIPKWLITINYLMIIALIHILYFGLVFSSWPQLNLKYRFIVSYALASIVPLSLLSVSAYGYILEYENTSIERANNELMISLKNFDSFKQTILKDYKASFDNAVKDKKLLELIENNGIESELVTKHVVKSIEKGLEGKYLPILGVRIYDENCNGNFATGTAPILIDIKEHFNSFESVLVNLLIDEINNENPEKNIPPFKGSEDNEIANNAYKTLSNRELKNDLNRHFASPIYKKNGDFVSYFIFDTVKVDGKSKYMLYAFWDDKTLDNEIVQKGFEKYALSNKNQNFVAYKIKGQNIDDVGKKTRHASKDFFDKLRELAKQASYCKKTDTFLEKDNIIVVMPALNFNQIIFVGWIDRINITLEVFYRIIAFVIIILISLLMLWICSLRSASVFIYPITALKRALDEVSLGNLNISFKNKPDNELGVLSFEFDKMIKELREKERLSKLISEQAVQALKKNSSGILNDTETFKGVALVSDIRNFTGMSEEYDPVIITELLNEHFAEMTKIISENGGLIYKYIGDAIEAVFPEKTELEESASERAFAAGFKMITRLKFINSRRKKVGLFPYRIGVGLCYGTMHSGTVGSVETRLDYSILGDPLKKAAKLEALSIQNPDFPIVISEDIAEKMATSGFGLKKIDSKNQDYFAYTLDCIENTYNPNFQLLSNNQKAKKWDSLPEKETDKIEAFSLSNNSTSIFKYNKNLLFYSLLVLLISILITFGFNIIYYETKDLLEIESAQMTSRLSEQLKCDGVLKSAFETLCLHFFEDINKALKQDDKKESFKQKISKIAEKYEKKGIPIPRYCCCLYNGNDVSPTEGIASKNFSDEACKLIRDLSVYLKLKDETNLQSKMRDLMGKTEIHTNIHAVYYRRSSLTKVLEESMYVDTDRIYDKDKDNIIANIFCGMPTNLSNKELPKYCMLLAEKSMLMALKNENGWYFSEDFPEKEKTIFNNSLTDEYLKEKGFYVEHDIKIADEKYTLVAISKDLYSSYYSFSSRITILFIFSIIISGISFWIFENYKLFVSNSIASRLRKDIFLSAILPILTVAFVSYLYVKGDFNVNKSELLFNLNNLMNEVENREYYYNPYYENIFKNLPKEEKVNNLLNLIINSESEDREKKCNELSQYLRKRIIGHEGKNNYCKANSYYLVKEIIIIGKDGWTVSASDNENENSLSFGNFISKTIKMVYFENANKSNTETVENALIADKLIETVTANYGNELSIKFLNFPNNLVAITNSFNSTAFYLGTFPNYVNPDYIIIALVLQENEFKSKICNLKNDIVPYKQHLASGSVGSELYAFYAPHIFVGNFFFYNDNDDTKIKKINREELRTLKELGIVSSWINSSYLPVSKKVDIDGIHYLEAKQGNIIKDNIFVALGSEYPILHKFYDNLKNFGYTIIYFIIMIFFIAQSIISDLLNPIRKLIDGVSAASKGNYKFRTDFTRKDELGTLCFSFDKMMKGLEEKQLMNRMVSRTALDVTSNLSDIQSKKVDVALLYVSVPGFDIIMKQTKPSELFSKLRSQIAAISEIVINNGGDIDKIMGEKLLIAFRSDSKTPEEIAVEASNVASLIETCPKLEYKVSVGVNYGTVISGYLGVGEKQDFTIIGDPVNVAARIAVYAEKLDSNKCLVSESIYNKIRNVAKAELYGEVALKGKSEPMKVYKLS